MLAKCSKSLIRFSCTCSPQLGTALPVRDRDVVLVSTVPDGRVNGDFKASFDQLRV